MTDCFLVWSDQRWPTKAVFDLQNYLQNIWA